MTSSIAEQPEIQPKWYTTKQVAVMLGYGLTKTKHLVSDLQKTCGAGS